MHNSNAVNPLPLAVETLYGVRKSFPVISPMSVPVKPLAAVAITACRVATAGNLQWLMIKRGKAPARGDWSLPGAPNDAH